MCLETIRVNDVEKYMRKNNILLIDLREENDYRIGHISGAINIPYDKLESYKGKLPIEKVILLYCERGNTSLMASRELSKEGYHTINLYGGIHAYRGRLVR